MSVNPVPRNTPIPADPSGGHSGLARWAVRTAAAVAVGVGASYTIFAVAYATGGDSAISDTWVGNLAGIALIGGLAVAFAAFLLAVVAKLRHERWRWLWLPLALFPGLATAVLLAELFWME